MRELDFEYSKPRSQSLHQRMSSRAWYVVYGAQRVNSDEEYSSSELALQLNSVYSDIEPYEIEGVLNNFLAERRHMNV